MFATRRKKQPEYAPPVSLVVFFARTEAVLLFWSIFFISSPVETSFHQSPQSRLI
jgi:hypothetical protein